MSERLPYRSAPLVIESAGPDRIRITIEATSGVRSFGWIGIPGCGIGAVMAYRMISDSLVGGVVAFVLGGIALALIWFLGYRRETLIDRDRGHVERVTSFWGIPARETIRLGSNPSAEVKARAHTSRSEGTTRTTYDYVAQIVGERGALIVGPPRRNSDSAARDVAPLNAFLRSADPAGVEESGVGVELSGRGSSLSDPALDGWTYPLAPIEASGDCPYCREALARPAAMVCCEQCRTGLHRDCALELGACPTLGCRNQRTQANKS